MLHYSQGGDRGNEALRTKWGQPIVDPPTMEGHQSCNGSAHAWNFAQDAYQRGSRWDEASRTLIMEHTPMLWDQRPDGVMLRKSSPELGEHIS